MGKNNSNNFIKFSQLRIVYNDSKVNKDKKITTLFKLHPSTFLELEDCDIGFQTPSKKKSDNNCRSTYYSCIMWRRLFFIYKQ